MPTLGLAIDASAAARGAGMFHTHSRNVTASASQMEKATGGANKSIKKMGGSLSSVAKLIGTLGIFYMFQRLARNAISFAAEQANTLAQLRAGLESTGGVSGQTMVSIQALSAEMQTLTTYSNETVESAAAVMLSFTNIADDVFPRAIKATADIATRMGTDLQSAVLQVAKALNDPAANLGALSRAGIQFSKDQKVLIKGLWETGRQAEAQRVILAELENQYEGSATGARHTLGGAMTALKNSFDDLLKSMVSEGALAMEFDRMARAIENYNKKGKEGASWWLRYGVAQRRFFGMFKEFRGDLRIYGSDVEEWAEANRKAAAALDVVATAAKSATDVEDKQQAIVEASRAKIDKEIKALENKTWALGMTTAESAVYYTVLRGGTKEQAAMVRMLHEQVNAFDQMTAREKAAARTAREFEESTERAREELEAFVRTPMEQLQNEMDRVYELGVKKIISPELWEDASAKIRKEMDALAASLAEVPDKIATPWENTANSIAGSIGGAVSDIIFDFENAGETAQRMLKQIASELLQYYVIRKMVASIGGYLGGLGGTTAANGLVMQGGMIVPFARGGVVDRPTPFPMSGGRTGVMGEGGEPEGILPLARGRDGKLGVRMDGGGGAVQNFTFNIQTPNADSFRRSQGQILADMRSGASRLKG